MEKQITLTPNTFKVLAGKKRVQILKELVQRRKTQSELAQKLGLAPPTIAEHLALLEKAGLVHAIDEGRKWKYFALTEKGREILNPGESRILVLLGTTFAAFIGVIIFLTARFKVFSALLQATVPLADQTTSIGQEGARAAAIHVPKIAGSARECLSQEAASMLGQGTPFALHELVLVLLIALAFGLVLGYYWRYKRQK